MPPNFLGRKHSEESKRKMSLSHKGKQPYPEPGFKKGHIPWNTGLRMSDEIKEKISKFNKGKTLSNEHKAKIGIANRGKVRSEEAKKLVSDKNRGRIPWNKGTSLFSHCSDESKQKIKDGFRKMMCKPNYSEVKLEQILNDLYPNEWRYIGNGVVWIGDKNPDFMNVNGQKKLIELFGEQWHKPEDEEIRKSHFKEFGFNTLIVWAKELRHPDQLKIKLSNFMEENVCHSV